jgi:hypothetical protein
MEGEQFVSVDKSPRPSSNETDANSEHLSPLYGIVHSAAWTLVPEAAFNENEKEKYLLFSTAARQDSIVTYDRLLALNAVVVYNTDLLAEQFVDQLYPGLRLRHAAGLFIELAIRMQGLSKNDHIYIHQVANQFMVLVFKAGKVHLANHLETSHPEDVRYYVLYTMKNLELPESTSLKLAGQAAENLALITGLKTYLPNVEVIDNPFGKKKLAEPNFDAVHFLGLYTPLCA